MAPTITALIARSNNNSCTACGLFFTRECFLGSQTSTWQMTARVHRCRFPLFLRPGVSLHFWISFQPLNSNWRKQRMLTWRIVRPQQNHSRPGLVLPSPPPSRQTLRGKKRKREMSPFWFIGSRFPEWSAASPPRIQEQKTTKAHRHTSPARKKSF